MKPSSRPSIRPKIQDARCLAAWSAPGSWAASAWAARSARAMSSRRSGSGKSASGCGQQITMAPIIVPESCSGSPTRAPPGQRPISGRSSPGGGPAGHQASIPLRATSLGSDGMSGCIRRQRPASRSPKPACPASSRPPSGSMSQSATAAAPAGASTSSSSAAATALPSGAASAAAQATPSLPATGSAASAAPSGAAGRRSAPPGPRRFPRLRRPGCPAGAAPARASSAAVPSACRWPRR